MRSRLLLVCFCCLRFACAEPSSPAIGLQSQPEHPEAKSDRYAGEAAVMEHLATVFRYAADGTGSKQIAVSLRVQTDAALRQLGVVTVPFASAEERVEFDYVRVRHQDGTVVETPASEAMEISSEVARQAPLYSDLKEKQLPVRSLRLGDTLEYQVRIVRTRAEAPGEFWGSYAAVSGFVVLDESVELRLPSSKEVKVWSPKISPTMKEESGERIYRWTSSSLEPTTGPAAEAKKEADKTRTLSSEEAKDLQFGKLPLIAWTTFKNWDAVGSWYRSLEADRIVADPEMKAKVAELLAGKSTDEERVRALYYYVATSIRYIGVDLGAGRYQPHLAAEVLRNQYGDCKDKHTLLAAMLAQAGFNAAAVLVGVGVRFNPDVPSPASFNHLITQLPVEGKTIWLDSTQEVAPYRALVAVVRDKDALVVPPTGPSRIEKTPDTLPYPSTDRFEAIGTLTSDGVAESHIAITARGDDELVFRAVIHQLSPAQYGDFIQGLSQNLGFAGTTSHPEISRAESTGEPVHIAYDYKREKPGDWDNLRIYPQLPPVNLGAPDEKNPPKVPIEFGLPRIESVSSALKLPQGWGATLPADLHVTTAFAKFDRTYRLEKGTLYADRKLEILKTEIPASEWKIFKKFTDDIQLNNEPEVQLDTSGTIGQLALTVNNPEAAQWMVKANSEIQSRHFDEALADLDRAKAINDQQFGLYALYGYRSAMQGKMEEAITFNQKELKLHPDNLYSYGALYSAQFALNQRKEAAQTLRDRLARSPDDRSSLQLAALLSADGNDVEAIAVLEDAKLHIRGKTGIDIALARTYLKVGKVSQGASTLVELIKTSEEAGTLNDAAYELANANVELDLAATTVHKALGLLASQSAALNADSDAKQALPTSRLIVATWDTAGWVLFRQHKFVEAEPYLRAAWLQGQHAEVGLHLGELEEAQGHLRDALATYNLASNAAAKHDPNGALLPLSPVAKEIADHLAALSAKAPELQQSATVVVPEADTPKGAKPARPQHRFDPSPEYALQQVRTIQLGEAGSAQGYHEFTVIFSSEGVAAVKATGGQPEMKDEDAILRRLDSRPWWPSGSPVKLLRQGVLTCQDDKCEFVYIPL